MKKIFITGSTQGLGNIAGRMLLEQGYEVILHARTEKSAAESKRDLKRDVPFVIGDVSSLVGIKSVAEQMKKIGKVDSIIHNVGVYGDDSEVLTEDGIRTMFAVNVLTPYVLSCLLERPERMIFLSSGMHLSGKANFFDLQWKENKWDATQAYCDAKLYVMMLTKWFASKWGGTYVNAIHPGWVPTRMGGAGAPDDLMKGAETQAWLSISNEKEALVTGKYFFHKKQVQYNPQADSTENQEKLVSYLKEISGIYC